MRTLGRRGGKPPRPCAAALWTAGPCVGPPAAATTPLTPQKSLGEGTTFSVLGSGIRGKPKVATFGPEGPSRADDRDWHGGDRSGEMHDVMSERARPVAEPNPFEAQPHLDLEDFFENATIPLHLVG